MNDIGSQGAFRWIRAVAIAISILFFAYAGISTWKNYNDPPGIDFVSFWAAGRLTLEGVPERAYDVEAHRAVERSAGTMQSLMPFPYPPTFLLVAAPLGAFPFWAALPAWIALLTILFYFVFRRFLPQPYLFAHPALFPNVLVGQNGMLTGSLFFAGLSLLNRREWLAGIIIGGLTIKPQLGVLIPVALIAGRYWKAIAGAALSSAALLTLAVALFGVNTLQAFLALLPEQAALLTGRIPWPKVASFYGALRTMDVPAAPAMALHAGLALAATIMTWVAWARHYSTRVPILASATLLVSPYLFNYDSLLLIIPVGWLIVERKRPAVIILLWALSAAALFAKLPNPTFIAATIALLVMWAEGRSDPKSVRCQALA